MQTETYEGWSNRETWAAALHIDNNESFHNIALQHARRYMALADKPEHQGGPFINPAHPADEIANQRKNWTRSYVAEALQNWLERWHDSLMDSATGRSRVSGDLARMLTDIGSLWRVDWRELADHFIAKAREIDNG